MNEALVKLVDALDGGVTIMIDGEWHDIRVVTITDNLGRDREYVHYDDLRLIARGEGL